MRRKIVYTIAAVKKFPTHAEVAFILESIIRYNNFFHDDRLDGLQNLLDGFLAHRDIYGFASYQPEHGQDLNSANEQEIDLLFSDPLPGEAPSPYREPGTTDPYIEQSDYKKQKEYLALLKKQHEERTSATGIIAKFKATGPASGDEANTGAPFST